jgi:hypothetical protein
VFDDFHPDEPITSNLVSVRVTFGGLRPTILAEYQSAVRLRAGFGSGFGRGGFVCA